MLISMNTSKLILLLSAALVLSGCQTTPTPAELTLIETVTAEATWVGVATDLRQNPDHRDALEVTQAALAAMIRTDTYTPELLATAVKNLPAIHGESGALVEGGAYLFTIAVGFIPIDDAPRVKAVIKGLHGGIQRALVQPAMHSAKRSGVVPDKDKLCVVPKR